MMGVSTSNQELAVERHESLTQLSLSCLATMVNIPLEVDTPMVTDMTFLYSLYTDDHV